MQWFYVHSLVSVMVTGDRAQLFQSTDPGGLSAPCLASGKADYDQRKAWLYFLFEAPCYRLQKQCYWQQQTPLRLSKFSHEGTLPEQAPSAKFKKVA